MEFTSAKEMARRLDCSMTVAYTLLDKDEVKSVYQGSRRKVLVSSLDEYMASLLPYRD